MSLAPERIAELRIHAELYPYKVLASADLHELLDAAEQLQRAIQALQEIAYPFDRIAAKAKEQNMEFEPQWALKLSENAGYLRGISVKALEALAPPAEKETT